jgi:hypothetical protein
MMTGLPSAAELGIDQAGGDVGAPPAGKHTIMVI